MFLFAKTKPLALLYNKRLFLQNKMVQSKTKASPLTHIQSQIRIFLFFFCHNLLQIFQKSISQIRTARVMVLKLFNILVLHFCSSITAYISHFHISFFSFYHINLGVRQIFNYDALVIRHSGNRILQRLVICRFNHVINVFPLTKNLYINCLILYTIYYNSYL